MNILRDLSLLQIQMRELPGFLVSLRYLHASRGGSWAVLGAHRSRGS